MSEPQRVAILGASKKTERYAHKAFKLLQEYGHEVIPVNPALEEIEGVPVAHSLRDIGVAVDTLTVYIGPRHIKDEIDSIVALAPRRVILNPGTESSELKAALDEAGTPYLEACTLVLLKTSQF